MIEKINFTHSMYFFLAIIVSAIVSSILGLIWYSKFGFQDSWVKASGITPQTQDSQPTQHTLKTFTLRVVLESFIAWLLAYLILRTSAETIFGSMEIGLRIWVFAVLPIFASAYIWEKKTFLSIAILSGHRLITILSMAIIIALFY